ncbi:MAG: HupE/UreJ family protein [Erythrobacter sp.]|nr:HupE/UreJ family protein [Erythrobacter sp.]
MSLLLRRVLVLALAMLAMLPAPALADDNRPLAVTIEQQAPDRFRVTWKVPSNVEARHLPALAAPGCTADERARLWSDPLGHWREEQWTCPQGITDQAVTITYPLANPGLATIVRYFDGTGGDPRTVLLQPQDTGFTLAEEEETQGSSFLDFLVLGIEHIWIGVDHLLFVAGLIFIARTPRRILATITGFTIAHSITLALSALDLVRVPVSAVEAVIALSIVFLAVEIVKGPRDTLTWRKPIVVASSFGLLHGFGFAAVLRQIGLPEDGLLSALLAFNLGIEIGQVVFAALVMGALWLLHRAGRRLSGTLPVQRIGGYLVGCLASFWMIQRLVGG